MTRTASVSWVWKPAAALALAVLLAAWCDAAPPVPLGSTTTTATKPAAPTTTPATTPTPKPTATTPTTPTPKPTATTPTTPPATTTPAPTAADPLTAILAMATEISDALELKFSDPLEEVEFFFAVAELYFQMQRQHARPAGGRGGAVSGSASGLGSLTTLGK